MEKMELQNRYANLKNVLWNRDNTDDSHLKNIVRKLHNALLADFTFIGKLKSDQSIDTLALFHNGDFLDNFNYKLATTPCETAVTNAITVTQKDATNVYPDAALLKELNIQAYAGVALYNINNEVIGVLASMFTKPIADKELTEMFLQMFAPQASIELEHLL